MSVAEIRLTSTTEHNEERLRWIAVALSLFLTPCLGFLCLSRPWLALRYFLHAFGLISLLAVLYFLDLDALRTMPHVYPFVYVMLVNVAGALHAANVPPRPFGYRPGGLPFSAIALGSLPALTALAIHTVMTFAPTYRMPSPSMEPTLAMNKPFLVILAAYRWQSPSRGDLVLYRSTSDLGEISRVSRIIGMPGDTVAMKGGIPVVNGKKLPRQQINNYALREGARIADVHCYIETLADGTSYSVLEQDRGQSGRYDNHPVYTVPPEAYFVISDNRDGARDSRDMKGVGFVSRDTILGRAVALRATPDSTFRWNARLANLRAMAGF